jgi:putative effector of murein hydrolase LrgA (UPF0299 family)
MRTGFFLLAAFLLLAAVLILGKMFSANYPSAMTVAVVAYVVLWFVIAAANMWTGVAKAGYSYAEELPVFALIFAVPAVVAILAKWRLF